MGLMDSLRAKYELYRLEQRYTRRDKRKTFTTGATYVDGEYVYAESPTFSTSSSNNWGTTSGGGSWAGKRTTSIRVKDLMGKGTRT